MMGSEAILCVLVVHLLLAAGDPIFYENFLISFFSFVTDFYAHFLISVFLSRIVGDLPPLVPPPVEDSCASKGGCSSIRAGNLSS